MTAKLPSDFAKKIAEALGVTEKWIDEWFEFSEDKQGYFIAKLKAKKFLEIDHFRTLCSLARDLGGDYVKEARGWKIPGPFVGNVVRSEPQTQPMPQADVESKEIKPSDEYFIAKSVTQIGYLYPVLKDVHGNVIDGFHRLNIDPNWPVRKVEEVTDPVQLVIARLIANVCRREVTAEEKTEWLRQIATLTGWTPKEIAANLPVSYTWVMKYLPDEFKERPGVGPSEYPVTRRVTEMPTKAEVLPQTAEAQPKFVCCDRCGVATSRPLHLRGRFYCEVCAEKLAAEAEARRAMQPQAQAITSVEEEIAKPPEPSEPLLTGFEVECPECHRKLLINHVEYPDGRSFHEVEGE